MTLQYGNEKGVRKVLKTYYQNQFQLEGYAPWCSSFQYETYDDAVSALSGMHFMPEMKVTTITKRVILRVEREEDK